MTIQMKTSNAEDYIRKVDQLSMIQAKGSLINRYYTAYMVDLYSYSYHSK